LGQFSKNYRTFYPKNCHQALKNMGLGSRGQKGTGSRIRIRNTAVRHSNSLYEFKEGYTLHIYTTGGKEGYTLHVHTLLTVKMDISSFHTADGGQENTPTSTLLTVGRATPSRTQCWRWKGIHPYVYIVDRGKGDTPTSPPCWGGGNVYTVRHRYRYYLKYN
jgi:hypothetical protein